MIASFAMALQESGKNSKKIRKKFEKKGLKVFESSKKKKNSHTRAHTETQRGGRNDDVV
jgi:ABC-type uncharacterized transport system substrate-binding protein